MTSKLIAFALAGATLAVSVATPLAGARADWRGYGYGRGGYGYGHHDYGRRGYGPGAVVGGALLGLGVGALLAAPYAAPAPRVVYAPPPPAYYPPPYAYVYAPYRYAPPPPPAYYVPY